MKIIVIIDINWYEMCQTQITKTVAVDIKLLNHCPLPQVMQDSLGGNAKTLMIVNISPSECNIDETLTSLM